MREREGSILNNCWKEKELERQKNKYGKEREKYYNRNGRGVKGMEEVRREKRNLEEEITRREKDGQRIQNGKRIKQKRLDIMGGTKS